MRMRRAGGGGGSNSWKTKVRLATTAAGVLASDFNTGDMVDGSVLVLGDRILIKDQADPKQNGIYVVKAVGAPSRAADADTKTELDGMVVYITGGTANHDTAWAQQTEDPDIGVDNIVFLGITAAEIAGLIHANGTVPFAANQSMGGFTLTNVVDPTADGEAANKNYADRRDKSNRMKKPVRAATTAAIALANLQTVDGVVLADLDEVLVKNQAAAKDNGIYVVHDGSGWLRRSDFIAGDLYDDVNAAIVSVLSGTVNAGLTWKQTAINPVIDTDPITFALFSPPPIASIVFADSPFTSTIQGFVKVNAVGGAITHNLPKAAVFAATNPDRKIIVKKTDASANVATITPDGAETIDGAATYPLAAQYDAVTLLTDGSTWHVV